jgi:hypothetical protein
VHQLEQGAIPDGTLPVALIDWRQLLRANDGFELRPGARASEVAAAEAAPSS